MPTIAEAGLPGFGVSVWQGLLAPVGTDTASVERLGAAVRGALAWPALRERPGPLGVEAIGSDQAGFGRVIGAGSARWAEVVRRWGPGRTDPARSGAERRNGAGSCDAGTLFARRGVARISARG